MTRIFSQYAITNKEEEAIFVKKIQKMEQKVRSDRQSGKLCFERMDDKLAADFVMRILEKFITNQAAFASVSRE